MKGIATRYGCLKFPSYNWVLGGSTISLIAEQIDMLALNWLVYQWTNSPMLLGIFTFFRLIPLLLFSFVGGLLADRWDRRKLLVRLQFGMMMLTFLLAFSVAADLKNLYILAGLVLLRSTLMAIETPVWHAYMPNLVDKPSVTSAVAVFSTCVNLARIIGPALGGFFIEWWGVENLFFLTASGYIAILGALLYAERFTEGQVVQTGSKPLPDTHPPKAKAGMGEALTYLRRQPTLLQVLLLGVITMVFGFSYTSMMPVFAQDLLGLDASGFGYLLSAAAVGSVIGAMFLAGQEEWGLGRLLVISGTLFGLCLFLFGFSRSFPLSLCLMFFVGLVGQTFRTTNRVIFQQRVPDRLRGRVMSLVLSDRGFIPLGSLLVGYVAQTSGSPAALQTMGLVCMAAALIAVLAARRLLKM
ncbi:MAG TPA: MFS transporter [Bacilli bacterium]|nr:MFS transporter [Bacilli bacterium]